MEPDPLHMALKHVRSRERWLARLLTVVLLPVAAVVGLAGVTGARALLASTLEAHLMATAEVAVLAGSVVGVVWLSRTVARRFRPVWLRHASTRHGVPPEEILAFLGG